MKLAEDQKTEVLMRADFCLAESNSSRATTFDAYANDYREVVNKTITSSGEEYEYFVELRVNLMFDRLNRYVPDFNPNPLLDYGCGTGATEASIKKRFPDGLIWGIDESIESIRVAESRGVYGTFYNVVMPDGSIPLADKSVGLIYMNGTVHHVAPEKRLDVISEVQRVLKPGGYLFVFENNPYNPLTRRAMSLNPFDKGCSIVSKKEVEELGRAAGLRVVESWYYFFFPNFLKALRPHDDKLRFLPFGGQYCVWFQR